MLHWAEGLWDWIFFIALSICKNFCFSPFTLIDRSRSAIHLSLLTPLILHHSDFMKSLATSRKSFRIFRKLSRRSTTMTRPWRECSCKQLTKGEVGEPTATNQRNLTTKASIADIAAKVEDDQWECHKLTQAPCRVGQNGSHYSLQGSAGLKEVRQWWVTKMLFEERKKEQLRTCGGGHSFLTILDNVLTSHSRVDHYNRFASCSAKKRLQTKIVFTKITRLLW